ncbi:Conserved_hypothetical protein [Hexamita inflata]|uniref:Uncharacterized protein n=3 Tax=Hexamita inflata TaxID=28002 RepID=A0AA86NAT5_9EUKA|nr:Conserved hypothetical protein [Hexamita inflata]CAI9939796.1 Conserved hypothetical protein [Hexamita inflata]CAI9956694.1 Conserved hypothetical protein [Hexamita inflata]
MSYSFIGFFGSKGKGKSTQMFRMRDEYVKQSKQFKYDLNNPFILNGPITHTYFVSPTLQFDKTFKKNDNNDTIQVEGTKDNILELVQKIRDMKKELQPVMELQLQVREFFKKSKNLSQTLDRQTAILIINVLKQIENMKQKYPELIIDETDKDIISNLKEFYGLLEGKVITSFIRMPKIILILDDMSSCSLFCQVQENEFYKMIIQQRHLNIFAVFIAAHEMSTLYSAFKTQLTGFLLFQGINYEKMKDYFSQVQELQSDYFSMTDFMNLYKYKICAAHEKNDVEKQKYVHKFLYVVICPTSKVYEGFNIRLK